jgi:hypothetical protein
MTNRNEPQNVTAVQKSIRKRLKIKVFTAGFVDLNAGVERGASILDR